MCITKVDNSNEKYYLIIIIKLIYNVPDIGLTLTKKTKTKTHKNPVSEYNFANIFKIQNILWTTNLYCSGTVYLAW